MSKVFEVRIVGRSGTRLSLIEDELLISGQFRVQRKLVVDFTPEAFNADGSVDVMIVDLSDDWAHELEQLGRHRRASDRPPLLTVASSDSADVIKMAMKAGARDFFSHPVNAAELTTSLTTICQESTHAEAGSSSVTVFMNAKGGAGTSTVAANVAHLLATERRRDRTVLVDFDIAGAQQPLYFDLKGSGDLREALSYSDSLDEAALQGYLLKHESGVHVMAATQEIPVFDSRVPATALSNLISMLSRNYQQLIFDVQRPSDMAMLPVLQAADRYYIVMQQTLMDLQGARRLLNYLDSIGVERSRLKIIVNRQESRHPVKLADIEAALEDVCIFQLPNDYRRVSQSVNVGQPLSARWKKAPITVALREVVHDLLGVQKVQKGWLGLFKPSKKNKEQHERGEAA